MKPLFIYPVKACSTRLPRKNLLEINGVPVFCYGLNATCAAAKYYEGNAIVLSTESEEVKSCAARFCGFETTPYRSKNDLNKITHIRGEKYAKDPYQTFDVCKFVIKELKLQDYDPVVLIQSDNPFILPEDIINCVDLYIKNCGLFKQHNSVRTVVDINSKLWQHSVVDRDNIYFLPEYPHIYRSLGTIMVCSMQYLLRNSHWGFFATPYVLPKERSYDINDELDFICAKAIMEKLCESHNMQ